jgi:hypothetical protein
MTIEERRDETGTAAWEAGYRETRFVPPRSLGENPLNATIHTPEQYESVKALVREAGWIMPAAVVNLATGLMVDGHLRKRVAVEEGHDLVPVAFGEWTEDQERAILAFLNATSSQARIDLRKWAALTEGLRGAGGLLGEGSGLATLASAIERDPFFRRGAGSAVPLLGQSPVPTGPVEVEVEDAGDGPDPGEDEGEVAEAADDGDLSPEEDGEEADGVGIVVRGDGSIAGTIGGASGNGLPPRGTVNGDADATRVASAPPASAIRTLTLHIPGDAFPAFERSLITLAEHWGLEDACSVMARALATCVSTLDDADDDDGTESEIEETP